jgi:G3E family GTPase
MTPARTRTRVATGTVRRTVFDTAGLLDSGETPLVNDCACCALREDLVPELLRLAEVSETPLAVVELWDSVEPQTMAEVIASAGLSVSAVITAVDPALVLPYLSCGDDLLETGLAAARSDERTVADTFARQLEYAPVLAVARTESDADPADAALLGQLHPTARRVTIGTGELAAAAARQHPACALLPQEADEHGVVTAVWHRTRPFHPERLYTALEDITCAAVRSRGRFWLPPPSTGTPNTATALST